MKRRHVWPEGHWAWPIEVSHKHGLRCGQMIWKLDGGYFTASDPRRDGQAVGF